MIAPVPADMEGPTVKQILWRIGSPQFEKGSREFPEVDSAQRRMRRLRRRIRLICAGCSDEPIRMTVVRRELPLSRSASRPAVTRRRIASARTLQSCPHRAGTADAQEGKHGEPSPLALSGLLVLGHRRPQKAGQLTGDSDYSNRGPFAVPDQVAIAAMQSLLSAPGVAHDVRGAAPPYGGAGRRPPWADGDSARRLRPARAARGYCPPW